MTGSGEVDAFGKRIGLPDDADSPMCKEDGECGMCGDAWGWEWGASLPWVGRTSRSHSAERSECPISECKLHL
jgi:hypothetical protein